MNMPDTLPTIQSALEEFARERLLQLPESQRRRSQRVLLFLGLCINNYGHRNLDEKERDEFERHYYAPGEAQRHFFEVFGPQKLLAELEFFHSVYLKKEVQTTEQVENLAASVVDDLQEWLVEKGYVDEGALESEQQRAILRKSKRRRAAKIQRKLEGLGDGDERRESKDFVDCDHHLVARIHPGQVWLRVYRGPKAECIGPIEVPEDVSEMLEVGWTVCAGLRRVGSRWRFEGVSEVYPRL